MQYWLVCSSNACVVKHVFVQTTRNLGKFATSLPLSGYVRSIAICASLLGSLVSSDQKKKFSEDCHRVNLFYYVSSFVFVT